MEWFYACNEAEGFGNQASFEAKATIPEGKKKGLEMSQLVEFDPDVGLASYTGPRPLLLPPQSWALDSHPSDS